MNKKIIGAILAGAMILNTSLVAFANPITSEQKQQVEQKQAEYSDAEAKRDALEQKLQELQGQAQKLDDEINKNNEQVKEKESNVSKLEKDNESLKADLDKKEKLYGERIRAIYKSGNPGYLELILNSGSFSELATNVQSVAKLMNLDKQMMEEVRTKTEQIKAKKEEINKEIDQVKTLKAENQAKLDKLNADKEVQKKLVDEATEVSKHIKVDLAKKEATMIEYPKSVIENSNSSIADLKAAIESLRQIRSQLKVTDKDVVDLIEKAKAMVDSKENPATLDRGGSNVASSYPSGGGNATGSAAQLLSIAYGLQGRPYVYGATGPSTFDCSGFTQYVYGKIGVGLTRTTYTQVNEGTSVPISQAQPGDLVFFGSASSPHHVGIYVGNGQYIHAPQTGDVVKVSSLGSRSDVSAVRRIL